MAKHKELIDIDAPYKLVASGFPIMRFGDEAKALESFRRFQGPGGCMLISYADGRRGDCLGYKFLKR